MVNVPTTIKGIQEKIERNAEENFILLSVPELFFWTLGLEYFSDDKISFEVD